MCRQIFSVYCFSRDTRRGSQSQSGNRERTYIHHEPGANRLIEFFYQGLLHYFIKQMHAGIYKTKNLFQYFSINLSFFNFEFRAKCTWHTWWTCSNSRYSLKSLNEVVIAPFPFSRRTRSEEFISVSNQIISKNIHLYMFYLHIRTQSWLFVQCILVFNLIFPKRMKIRAASFFGSHFRLKQFNSVVLVTSFFCNYNVQLLSLQTTLILNPTIIKHSKSFCNDIHVLNYNIKDN